MFCRYCGKAIADDSDFCTYCGKPLFEKLNNISTEEKTRNISASYKAKSNFFTNNISLLVKAFCYIALGVFLFFNIKMAPFYSGWKLLAYIAEGTIAIVLTVLTKRKIADSSYMSIKMISLTFSILVILSSITLRIVYDAKVDMVEKDIPSSGTILVDVGYDTDYYSYITGVVYDPNTSVEINGANDDAKITFGQPTKLEITVKGNQQKDSISDIITLHPSDFVNGKYTITKHLYLDGGPSASVDVKLRRYCTFWEVIFY